MVAIPRNAATHIQKIAPGPPIASAVAAPAMLPVPTWAAIAVASAWNEESAERPLHPFFKPSYLDKAKSYGKPDAAEQKSGDQYVVRKIVLNRQDNVV